MEAIVWRRGRTEQGNRLDALTPTCYPSGAALGSLSERCSHHGRRSMKLPPILSPNVAKLLSTISAHTPVPT
ncbi:Chaperone protein DnaJ [Clarias magur]|uniref:Chaperone protein DnaJ n=1 Tax=Clarias magur TaxID=1594786 RepID=A0A8J4UFH5_CLAMG|nr:Chaperone protein DnaJ [Clarias magur]